MKITEARIREINNNVFPRSIHLIDLNGFKFHKDAHRKNSSQVLAVDFWGCLKLSKYKNQIINMLFKHDCINWDIKFECTFKNLLNEHTSTQIDVLLESETNVIIIESKFTEDAGGSCSQTKINNRIGKPQCNGFYQTQINPINNIEEKCSLTGKGIQYWKYIFDKNIFDKNIENSPCPIKGEEFQWIRNICFAAKYGEVTNKKSECFLVYYQSDKCPISKKVANKTYLGKLKGQIKDTNAFQAISYNELLEKAILFLKAVDKDEMQVWIDLQEWMKKKEQQL